MKKLLVVGVIVLFLGVAIAPSTGSLKTISNKDVQKQGIFFGLKSHLEISWNENDTKEPLHPLDPLRDIDINISYWNTWGIFGKLISFFYGGKGICFLINMRITDYPNWCSANFALNNVPISIPSQENDKQSTKNVLKIQVSHNAPAFEIFDVTIKATINPIRGPFGFLNILQGINYFENISFKTDYMPFIQPWLPEGNTIETPPLIQVELPIEIENFGNGKTTVKIKIVDYPDDWNVSIQSQLILEVGEKKEILLNITSPSNFSGYEQIMLSFTPHYYYNHSLIGPTNFVTILAYYHQT